MSEGKKIPYFNAQAFLVIVHLMINLQKDSCKKEQKKIYATKKIVSRTSWPNHIPMD